MLAVLCLCAANLAAQTSLVLPAAYQRAWGSPSNLVLGANSSRTQIVFARPFPIGTVLLGIGLRDSTGTADNPGFTADLEISVSSTAALPGALNVVFGGNVGSDVTTVLPRQLVAIAPMPANRSTGAFTPIPFTTPFVTGLNSQPNLLIDIKVFGRSAGAQWSTDRALASPAGRATTTGVGCGAGTITSTSALGNYVVGSNLTVELNNAPPGTLALLTYSFDQQEAAAGVLLPLSLGSIGAAPNCDLMVNPSGGFSLYVADLLGAASQSFVVPPLAAHSGVGMQWGYFVPTTPANPLGLEITANRTIWIGPEFVGPAAGCVFDVSSSASPIGTPSATTVPIVQIVRA